jgi:small basic protein
MSLLPILALLIGFLLFWVPSHGLQANETIARYSAIAILAGLDTILGGLRASMEDKFDNAVFVSGFFVNVLLAAGLLWLGEYFGLETSMGENRVSVMLIAVVVIFSTRILNNLAALRRDIIERLRQKQRAAEYSEAGSGTSAANLVK